MLPPESFSSKAIGTGEGNYEFYLTNYLFHTLEGSFLHAVKSYMGPTALLPP
jgi:hypothetical protein